MLSHLSGKFNQGPSEQTHEPRAALFLNRFTRTLTIMYATSGIEEVMGISGEELKGKSFYFCIQDQCQQDAIRCLESAKGNDSIAYLRFMFQDPRLYDPPADVTTDDDTETDVSMTDVTSDEEEESSGSREQTSTSSNLQTPSSNGTPQNTSGDSTSGTTSTTASAGQSASLSTSDPNTSASRTSSADSGNTAPPLSPSSSAASNRNGNAPSIELEAVVSCTSDGLVVCLRRARPAVPATVQPAPIHHAIPPAMPVQQYSGLFAAPWAVNPVFVPPQQNYQYFPQRAAATAFHGGAGMAQRPLGPSPGELFRSIRDVAVFAWALTGINGSLAEHSRGTPKGESQPPDGLPVWEGQKAAYGSAYGGQFFPTPASQD